MTTWLVQCNRAIDHHSVDGTAKRTGLCLLHLSRWLCHGNLIRPQENNRVLATHFAHRSIDRNASGERGFLLKVVVIHRLARDAD